MMRSDLGDSTADVRDGQAAPHPLNHGQEHRKGVADDRVLKTICLLSCFLTLGLSSPLVGNTLVHLEYFFDASPATISLTITVQAFGYLFGAIVCGFVFDRVNHELAFAVANVIRGLSTILAPFIGGIVPFIAAMGVHMISSGFVDASGQSYCVGLWTGHRYRDSLLQASHAVWSLGGTLGPFINTLFLVDLPQREQQQNQSASTAVRGSTPQQDSRTTLSSRNLTSADDSTLPALEGVADFRYAYVTIGSLILVANILYIIAYLRGRFIRKRSISGKSPSPQHSRDFTSTKDVVVDVEDKGAQHSSRPRDPNTCFKDDTVTGEDSKKLDKTIYMIFIGLVFVFCHLYPYGEATPITCMTTFAVKYLNFPIQDASLLMSLFFGLHFAGRVLGVPIAGFLKPRTMLTINLSSTAVSFVLLLAFINVWPTIVWISAPMAGLSMSTTFATTILWISDRVPITGRMSSIILVGFSSGAIAGPLIVSQLFEALSPMWFVYVVVIASLSHLVMFVVTMVFDARCGGDRVRRQAASARLRGNDCASLPATNGCSSRRNQ